ncbi:MAG: type II-A CRISPR-associated protein Csn2, partial [Enterococcus sp.]|nr:type II-A CRISPR-associated protein Csn2 [Enterococcus sp.]
MELLNHELNLSCSDLTMYNFFKMYEVKVQTSYKTLFEKSLEIV